MFKISGNLTADSVKRFTAAGKPVLGFTVAVNNGKDKEGKDKPPTYVDCSVWGENRVTQTEGLLKKGISVDLTGEGDVEVYKAKDESYRGKITLNVSFGDVVTFNGKGNPPTKTALFTKAAEPAAA
jgi:single-strand DNA-binding protein